MKLQNLVEISLVLVAAVACVATEAPEAPSATSGDPNESLCTTHSDRLQSLSWSLGDPFSASLVNGDDGSAIICVYKGEVSVTETAPIYLDAAEFVASQTCSYRGKASTAIFGIGIRADQEVALRLAWNFDETRQVLEQIDEGQVRCIYSEMDE